MRDPLMLATGKALALVVAALQRDGVLDSGDFGRMLVVFSATCAEAEPEQGAILATWAAMVEDIDGQKPAFDCNPSRHAPG